MWRKMEKLGIRKERLELEWVSASEGIRFQQAMEKMEQVRQSVTSEEIHQTRQILAARKEQENNRRRRRNQKNREVSCALCNAAHD